MTVSPGLDSAHFIELRRRINDVLIASDAPYANAQINEWSWLYGALGAVPSDTMFICENPSVTGIRSAAVETIDGDTPDIEAQWWGGATNNAAKRFRQVLHDLGLKTTPPSDRGGWRCYITNVVKEANIADAQGQLSPIVRKQQACTWSEILRWEHEQVRPSCVICIGGMAELLVRHLQSQHLFPKVFVHSSWHYSARSSDHTVCTQMRTAIESAIQSAQ